MRKTMLSRSRWSHSHVVRGFGYTSLLSVLLQSFFLAFVHAQITLDGSLGGPAETLSGPDYVIDASQGNLRGDNLFHSFGEFNIQTGESATFTGPRHVDNVVGRVTGTQSSFIDGSLRSEIPDANLYLLNPNGVLFGENASLDVDGSFHVSTGDYVDFADGGRLYADPSQASILSIAPPEAFGFLSENPAGISLSGGSLQVPKGETLSLIGGDLDIQGREGTAFGTPSLGAPEGQIHLASVSSAGEVLVGAQHEIAGLDSGVRTLAGNIAITQGARVDTSGTDGGAIFIRGGAITVDNATLAAVTLGDGRGGVIGVEGNTLSLSTGAEVVTSTQGEGQAGTINVDTVQSVTIAGQNQDGTRSGLFSNTFGSGDAGEIVVSTWTFTLQSGGVQAATASESTGDAGNITLDVDHLTLTEGAQLDASSFGDPGSGGHVHVTAEESVKISGQGPFGKSGIFSNTFGRGGAGEVMIKTSVLTVEEGILQSTALGGGAAGKITINVDRLTLTEGAQLDSSHFGESRQGGDITVNAIDSVLISGRGNTLLHGLFSSSGLYSIAAGESNAGRIRVFTSTLSMSDARIVAPTIGNGNGGTVIIEVDSLALTEGAQISTSSGLENANGVLFVGDGNGGTVRVSATESLRIAGRSADNFLSGIFSNTSGQGNGGALFVSAPQLVIDGGRIVTNTLGGGDAGEIVVEGGEISLINGGQIFAGTGTLQNGVFSGIDGSGRGGDISVYADKSIFIAGRDEFSSGIFSTAQFGSGNGGDIVVKTPILLIQQDGSIAVAAFRTSGGSAGNIILAIQDLTLTKGAKIDSSTFGIGRGGRIEITANGTIELNGASEVASRSEGTGDAGDIRIHATKAFISRDSTVTTETVLAGGGSIELTKGAAIQLINSEVSTSVQGGGGDAGNITIQQEAVVLNDSQVIANAFAGMGGNVRIDADIYLASTDSRVDASSALGIAGTVDVRAPISEISGTFAPLPETFLAADEILREQCAHRTRREKSTFIIRGREGLPGEPGIFLPSPLYLSSTDMSATFGNDLSQRAALMHSTGGRHDETVRFMWNLDCVQAYGAQ